MCLFLSDIVEIAGSKGNILDVSVEVDLGYI